MTNQVGYIKVQKELRKKIIKGDYALGSLLPSENKLSEYYGFSRMTIRHALKNIENEGLISRHQGKGSIVTYLQKSIELLSIKGFTEIMKDQEQDISTLFIKKPKLKTWDKDFYWTLGAQELETDCIHFSRVRMIGKKSIMYEDTCISSHNLNGFCKSPFVNNSLFDTLLINHDIEITDVNQKFRAVTASKKIAKKLGLKKGKPVLEIVRKLSTSNPQLYIYSFIHCNTDDFTIET